MNCHSDIGKKSNALHIVHLKQLCSVYFCNVGVKMICNQDLGRMQMTAHFTSHWINVCANLMQVNVNMNANLPSSSIYAQMCHSFFIFFINV